MSQLFYDSVPGYTAPGQRSDPAASTTLKTAGGHAKESNQSWIRAGLVADVTMIGFAQVHSCPAWLLQFLHKPPIKSGMNTALRTPGLAPHPAFLQIKISTDAQMYYSLTYTEHLAACKRICTLCIGSQISWGWDWGGGRYH